MTGDFEPDGDDLAAPSEVIGGPGPTPRDRGSEPDEPDGGAGADATDASSSSWRHRAVVIGWGLFAVVVVLLVGTVAEGFAASGRQGSLFARLGAAFVGQAGASDGLALLAAAALACWSRASRLLLASFIAAVVLCAVTPLAMLGDVANVRHVHQPVNGLLRWELLTFFGVTFIPGLLAAAVAWWGREDGLARLSTDI